MSAPDATAAPDEREDVVRAGGGRRALWTFVDQALSSLTNFGLAIVVARTVSEDAFGAFSLALITFSFVIGIGRGLISDPFVVRYSDAPPSVHRAASARAAGAGLAFGVISGLVCALAALVLSASPGISAAFVALALALPGLMLQDVWRHVFFAAGRPFTAAMNDLVWTVVQVVLLGLLVAGGSHSIFWFTAAWGAAALAAAVAGCIQAGTLPAPLASLTWFRETRDLNVRMALDFALNMGAINLSIYAVTAIVGLAGAGALRAAQVLLGPLTLLYGGLSSFVLPVLARLAGSGRSLIRTSMLASAASAGIATLCVTVLLVLPQSIGLELLNASWPGARSVMLPSGLVAIAVGVVIGASLGLKALRRADQMLRVTFFQAPMMLGLGVLGAAVNGAVGAAWGFAVAQIFGVLVCWVIFVRADAAPRDWLDDDVDATVNGVNAPNGVDAAQPAARHANS
jgi:O-antigen/teichoic acid export membrane protein